MKYSLKTVLLLLSFILLISLAFNVYSLNKGKDSTSQKELVKEENESELLEKEEKIKALNKELEDVKKVKEPVKDEVNSDAEVKVETANKELENTAKRFIEYAFESDAETYTTRKKMAKSYMTDNLFETLYSSDGEDEELQGIEIDIKDVNVFTDLESEDEAIVRYTFNEKITSSGYEEVKKMYVKLSFQVKGNEFKVSDIEPLENEYGGI